MNYPYNKQLITLIAIFCGITVTKNITAMTRTSRVIQPTSRAAATYLKPEWRAAISVMQPTHPRSIQNKNYKHVRLWPTVITQNEYTWPDYIENVYKQQKEEQKRERDWFDYLRTHPRIAAAIVTAALFVANIQLKDFQDRYVAMLKKKLPYAEDETKDFMHRFLPKDSLLLKKCETARAAWFWQMVHEKKACSEIEKTFKDLNEGKKEKRYTSNEQINTKNDILSFEVAWQKIRDQKAYPHFNPQEMHKRITTLLQDKGNQAIDTEMVNIINGAQFIEILALDRRLTEDIMRGIYQPIPDQPTPNQPGLNAQQRAELKQYLQQKGTSYKEQLLQYKKDYFNQPSK